MDWQSETIPQIPMTMTFTPPEEGSTEPTWVCDPPSVTVDPKQMTIVVVSLVTDGSSQQATFAPQNAAVWQPPAPPAWAMGWWLNDPQDQSTVLNVKSINQGPTTKGEWAFAVNVIYAGENYTSPDPTIINIEPTGGDCQEPLLTDTIRDAMRELVA